jgi:hypothetical protein
VTRRARLLVAGGGLVALALAAMGLSRSLERSPDVVVPPPASDPHAGTLAMRDVVEVRSIAWPSLAVGLLGLGLLAAAALARGGRPPAPDERVA